jgi:Ca-activated chloride channel family protein
MSFQAPLFLLGLAVVPLALGALALARRRPARYVVRFPALPTLARVAPRGPRWRRIVPPALLCLALSGLALALARPETTVAVPVEQASVVLVTDTSGSMSATDVEPSRLDAAKDAAERFLDRVPDELRVGLVAYADAPNTVLRPSDDRDAVRAAIERLGAEGGTATGDALDSALRALGTRDGDSPPAAVVLLSDGATQSGRDPADVARDAAGAGVPVYTVALGTADGQVESNGRILRVPPDPEALREVAQLSGGAAFAAEDADALDEVYERLGSQIGTREEKREISAGFAAAGLLLLGGSIAASLRWRGRLP